MLRDVAHVMDIMPTMLELAGADYPDRWNGRQIVPLEMTVEDREVRLTFQNLGEVTVNCYEMDLEFLFSTNPFVESGGDRFSVIKPNYTAVVRLPKTGDTHRFSLPADFAGKNVLVEVLGTGRRIDSPIASAKLGRPRSRVVFDRRKIRWPMVCKNPRALSISN